jgi:Glycosyltransferase WbsX
LYGTVDEDSQEVIDHHLELAESVGIGVFAVNWYRDYYLSYPADRMAASTVAPSVKFCIQWSNHYASMDATAATKPFLFEGIRRAALRMSSPRYWTREGKPVLVILDTTHLDDVIRVSLGQPVSYTPSTAERSALVTDMRNIVGNVLNGDLTGGISGSTVSASANPGPYLVMLQRSTGWLDTSGIDAYSDYNVQDGTFAGVTRQTESYAEMESACRTTWNAGIVSSASRAKKYWPTLMAGWDKRAWGGSANPLHDNCEPTEAEFIEHCRGARLAAQNGACDNTVFLYAWNELGEGGWILPTQGIGRTRLDAIRVLTDAQ